MDNIINMESGTFHSVLQTVDQKFYSFGSNEFGELGYANKSANELKLIELPFTIKEGDEIQICCGKNFTIFIHETDNENSLKINDIMVTDNFKFNYEINSNFYLDLNLLKNISNDFYNLIKNDIIEHLNENDQKVLYYLIKNAIIDLNCLNIDDLFSNYDKFINFISFGELELNLVTCLFILNDINDIKHEIKLLLFNDISNRMNVDNIMRILRIVNNYLSLNILKQAKNSILLLLANKCLAFIKENATLLKSDPLFEIIQDKINNVKQPFKQINYKIDNLENIAKNVTESLKLLYNDESNSDIHVIINKDKNELLQLHKSILSVHSSVLNILFKNNENNVVDLYEFIEMMVSDHWIIDLFNNSAKINTILQIICKLCYGYEFNYLKLNDLVGILIIAQQLDITWIVKHVCILIVEKLYSINDTEFIILLNLASVSQNNNDCRELVEYFKIFCSNNLTLDYLQKIQLSCQENIPCNNFLKVIIDYWLRVNRK
ncbi:predicted protein [Naegleria gruberi]|uniref:Predicted protein n=1 Tax=Naegleria gruberi TaxID=5762 RepID=D2VZZ1_NAEGR|nr:uncharacterized protein NAEGRDRAFT_74669 [Naegleria gruberi]EFC37654.1 predicted protein [Naegleria gruberi]|eukprot:XP_002670398.1 predicted protein [Naegleria gruberi strain NEG-M]